eukprot:jgi/Picsp_1/1214/NSC_04695-R1_protein
MVDVGVSLLESVRSVCLLVFRGGKEKGNNGGGRGRDDEHDDHVTLSKMSCGGTYSEMGHRRWSSSSIACPPSDGVSKASGLQAICGLGHKSCVTQRIPKRREIRISCVDATGLGVDITRVLLECQMTICEADFVTDGSWCYLVLTVQHTSAVLGGLSSQSEQQAQSWGEEMMWARMKKRLVDVCPRDTDALRVLSHIPLVQQSSPYLVHVCARKDERGMLHGMSSVFADLDCTVFRARVQTLNHGALGPAAGNGSEQEENESLNNAATDGDDGRVKKRTTTTTTSTTTDKEEKNNDRRKDACNGGAVVDTFWVIDNKGLLPLEERGEEICEGLKQAFGGLCIECELEPAPVEDLLMPKNISAALESGYQDSNTMVTRLSCKDALSHSNLREISMGGGRPMRWSSSDSLGTPEGSMSVPLEDSFGRMSPLLNEKVLVKEFEKPEHVFVNVDTETSSEFIMLELECQDRKGLLYDLFLKLKEIRVRVAYCRVHTRDDRARVELTVQDAYGGDLCSAQATPALVQRIKQAAAASVHMLLGDTKDPSQVLLSVVVPVDAGGRGRPRVLFDITRVLSDAGILISEADIFMENLEDEDEESSEIHTFLLKKQSSEEIFLEYEKRFILHIVKASLEGHSFGLQGSDEEAELISINQADDNGVNILRSLSCGWKTSLSEV